MTCFLLHWNSKSWSIKTSYLNMIQQFCSGPIGFIWLLSYLKTVGGVKLQLVRQIYHSAFVGHHRLVHDWAFWQLKHPVSARSITDATCTENSRFNYIMKLSFTCNQRSMLSYNTCFCFELLFVDHNAAWSNEVWCAETYTKGQWDEILPKQSTTHPLT